MYFCLSCFCVVKVVGSPGCAYVWSAWWVSQNLYDGSGSLSLWNQLLGSIQPWVGPSFPAIVLRYGNGSHWSRESWPWTMHTGRERARRTESLTASPSGKEKVTWYNKFYISHSSNHTQRIIHWKFLRPACCHATFRKATTTIWQKLQRCFRYRETSHVWHGALPTSPFSAPWRWSTEGQTILVPSSSRCWAWSIFGAWSPKGHFGLGWCFCFVPQLSTGGCLHESYGWSGVTNPLPGTWTAISSVWGGTSSWPGVGQCASSKSQATASSVACEVSPTLTWWCGWIDVRMRGKESRLWIQCSSEYSSWVKHQQSFLNIIHEWNISNLDSAMDIAYCLIRYKLWKRHQSQWILPNAGFPYEVLANGHFVPQGDRHELSRYRGKQIWKEILDITPGVCNLYFARVNHMFNDAVTADFSNKMKAQYSFTCWFSNNINLSLWFQTFDSRCFYFLSETAATAHGDPREHGWWNLPLVVVGAKAPEPDHGRVHGEAGGHVPQGETWLILFQGGGVWNNQKWETVEIRNWNLGNGRNPTKSRRTPKPHVGSEIVMGFSKIPSLFVATRSF